jgi:hypothetical protein
VAIFAEFAELDTEASKTTAGLSVLVSGHRKLIFVIDQPAAGLAFH